MKEMEKNPVFSVIISVFNVQDYLEECVESVLGQQYEAYEILLIDDGSSDNSSEICDRYAAENKKVKTIHKKNEGAASARNEGIKAARGEWILFLDSDDYYGTSRFFSELSKKTEYTSAQVICYGETEVRDIDRSLIGKKDFSGTVWNNRMSEDEKLEKIVLNGTFSIACWRYAVKSSFLYQNRFFFNELLKREEDIEWVFRVMLSEPRLALLWSAPYVHRVRGNSVCTQRRKSYFWGMRYKAVEYSMENIKNSQCTNERKKILYQALAYIYYILLAELVDEPDAAVRKEFFNNVQKFDVLRSYKGSRKVNMSRFIINLLGTYRGAKILNYWLHYHAKYRGEPIRIEKGQIHLK